MTTEELLKELETNRAEQQRLFDAEKKRLDETLGAELRRLDAGIAALKGADLAVGDYASRGGRAQALQKTVPAMVEECAREFHRLHSGPVNGHTIALAITNKNIVDQARSLFPERLPKIKTGLCNAINSLKKRNVLKLTPGGLELVSPNNGRA